MSDLTLRDGKEINIDLAAINRKEYLSLFDVKSDKDALILSKASGLTEQEVDELNMLDYKRLLKTLIKKVGEPLADPN